MAGVYLESVNDVAGTVASQVLMAVFNPAGSGVLHVVQQVLVTPYAVAASTVANSLLGSRITSMSGGSLVPPAQISRFVSSTPDPQTQVRTGNPTISVVTGQQLTLAPPPIAAATGANGIILATPGGMPFVLAPGEGIGFSISAGDVDVRWDLSYAWKEADL